ncbi:VirK family protein [Francisella sp. 19X1-34]|uniref:VirK family protein n=1 Tax=Francisella sp. 19X1-34 TaxID=3087177 RepID=UPI002E32DEBC|nr:VirK family protein [Francisella sp. 19X1-34]MED7788460.1 VirK family protein [Francisella sp. 19X1-34]
MKKLLLIIVVLSPSFVFAATKLDSFKKIQESLSQGNKFTVVVDFKNCSSNIINMKDMNLKASFSPNAIMYEPSKSISFSDLHFTVNSPRYKGKPIYESVSYKLDSKGNLAINTQVLNAVDFSTIGKNYSISCQINKGVEFYQQ